MSEACPQPSGDKKLSSYVNDFKEYQKLISWMIENKEDWEVYEGNIYLALPHNKAGLSDLKIRKIEKHCEKFLTDVAKVEKASDESSRSQILSTLEPPGIDKITNTVKAVAYSIEKLMQECKADICIEIENFLEDNQCTLSESFKQEILKNVPTEMRQDLDIDTINNIFSDENQKLHLKNFLNSILGRSFSSNKLNDFVEDFENEDVSMLKMFNDQECDKKLKRKRDSSELSCSEIFKKTKIFKEDAVNSSEISVELHKPQANVDTNQRRSDPLQDLTNIEKFVKTLPNRILNEDDIKTVVENSKLGAKPLIEKLLHKEDNSTVANVPTDKVKQPNCHINDDSNSSQQIENSLDTMNNRSSLDSSKTKFLFRQLFTPGKSSSSSLSSSEEKLTQSYEDEHLNLKNKSSSDQPDENLNDRKTIFLSSQSVPPLDKKGTRMGAEKSNILYRRILMYLLKYKSDDELWNLEGCEEESQIPRIVLNPSYEARVKVKKLFQYVYGKSKITLQQYKKSFDTLCEKYSLKIIEDLNILNSHKKKINYLKKIMCPKVAENLQCFKKISQSMVKIIDEDEDDKLINAITALVQSPETDVDVPSFKDLTAIIKKSGLPISADILKRKLCANFDMFLKTYRKVIGDEPRGYSDDYMPEGVDEFFSNPTEKIFNLNSDSQKKDSSKKMKDLFKILRQDSDKIIAIIDESDEE